MYALNTNVWMKFIHYHKNSKEILFFYQHTVGLRTFYTSAFDRKLKTNNSILLYDIMYFCMIYRGLLYIHNVIIEK